MTDARPARRPSESPVDSDTVFGLDTELGRALAAVDWAGTPLGPVHTWPTSLRNVVRLQLASRFAMWMAWGPELTFFCNDAYRRGTLGAKYPWALGRPTQQVWAEIWPDIGPRIQSVVRDGASTWDEDLFLLLERSGYSEETYHTFSYSPITDDDGEVAGLLCVVSEETARVIGERRMATVRDLGTALAAASTTAEVCAAAGRQLAADDNNLPFALGYLFDDDRRGAELAFTAGIGPAHAAAPLRLAPGTSAAWPLEAAAAGRIETVEGLPERFVDLPTGAWQRPPEQALVVPFVQPGAAQPFGFLVAALNRHRLLDTDYQGFLELVAGQIAAALVRARAYEQERQRAEDLAALDRAKTAFFTNVSHELRTPLTLLLGPADDALRDHAAPLPTPQRERVEVVHRNAERLLKLVNTLLDFSRMQSGAVQARFEPLDLARYTAELAAMFDSAMSRAGLSLQVECTPLPQRVHVDREMWAKIVLNLLSNALKATFEGGVTVRLAARDGAAELSVSDTGIGIPPAEQRQLFERFHRVSGAALRSHEGSGIGLALVAELAGLHGGTVQVRSTPGEGSTFTVRVPVGTDHLPADQVHTDVDDEVPDVERYGLGYLAEADRWLSAPLEQAPQHVPGGRPRVLVVDDNADMREYVAGLLDRAYAVQTAVDGVQALELARSACPDLVLTDVMMPRLDGFGLLQQLRADPATMHVPVVMLSARSGDEATVEGLEAGADDYLVKPFSARELLARVRANLELDRVRRVAAELARSRELLDQAEELAHVASWEIDLRDDSMFASAEYLRMLGIDADQLAAGGLALAVQSVDAEDRQRLLAALERTASVGTPLDIEVHLNHPERGNRLVHAHGVLHCDENGAPAFLRGSLQDITEQRQAEYAVAASAAAREAAAREHSIAEELQRSLLPATTVVCDHLDVAAYYVSGVEGTQAGGDWYDVIDLGGGRTGLVVGDVMGRGVRAAAVMGQLRATVRAYARLDLPPASLLALLDTVVRETSESTIVTCVYAVHDPVAHTLTYGNAGHMPPLLADATGAVTRLDVGDPPLGTGNYAGRVATVPFPPGARLTLYTDGLVEHRGSDIDTDIDALAALFGRTDVPVEALPGRLVDSLLPGEPDDDVAVLAATARHADEPAVLLEQVAQVETSVSGVRAAAAALLAEWAVPAETVDDALLVISELVTNAVRHGRAPIEFRLRRDGKRLVVTVTDGETARPVPRPMQPGALNGRGLHLVEALSTQWGSRPTGTGKAVWCVLDLP